MRSVLIMVGLATGVCLLMISGTIPRHAGAQNRVPGIAPARPASLYLTYAAAEDEQRLLSGRPAGWTPRPRPHGELPPIPSSSTEDELPPPDPEPADAATSAPEPAAPIADAGDERVVWSGNSNLALDGSRSTGEGLSYAWRQLAGPQELTISHADEAGASVTLVPGSLSTWEDTQFEFELTVTDAYGRADVGRVTYTVKSAPSLTLTPRPKRYLAQRDGYLMAHFEVWVTGRRDAAASVELVSPAELFVQPFSGTGDYEVMLLRTGEAFIYTFSIYSRPDEPQTWLEFFIDTPQRVPALIQIGVNWE